MLAMFVFFNGLIVKGGSLLVIKQLVGVWQVKKDALKEWYYGIIKLCHQFEAIQFKHVSREENKEADTWAIAELQKDVAAMQVVQAKYDGREALVDVEEFLETCICSSSILKEKGVL